MLIHGERGHREDTHERCMNMDSISDGNVHVSNEYITLSPDTTTKYPAAELLELDLGDDFVERLALDRGNLLLEFARHARPVRARESACTPRGTSMNLL